MEDAEIIELYWHRDQRAIEETDRKYRAYCQGIAYNILRVYEDAEECVSDSYQRSWESIPPERPRRFKAWLGTLVRNISINRWKKDRAAKRGGSFSLLLEELGDCLPAPVNTEEAAELRELGRQINCWLSRLGEGERRIFLRRYWYGDSIPALAESLGMSENGLRQKLFRLRRGLRAFLEKEGYHI